MKVQDRLKKIFKGKRAVNIVIFIGLAGILMIFLSDYFPSDKSETVNNTSLSTTEYAEYLEEKLESIVSKINGAGKCDVAVTLAASAEYMYVYDENRQTATEQNNDGYSEKTSDERSYTKIKNDSGDETLVPVAVLTPSVNGVVIVCDGGSNESVKGAVTDAVAAALDIPKSKIYVTQRKR